MGSTNSISGNMMGAKMYFEFTSSYNASNNTSTVSVHPYYTTDAGTGGTNIYGGDLYGNGSSIYSMSSGYAGDYILTVPNTSGGGWAYCSVRSGSISSFTVQHNNSGNASFTCGFVGKARAMYDGTTASFSSSTGCSGSIYQGRTLNVSYNANGGSGAPSATYFYGSTESITLSSTTPTRTGYTFKGWAVSSTATTKDYSAGQNIGTRTSGLVLYAVWQINTWSVTYDANGGEGAPASQTKTYGQTLVLSTDIPTRTGYSFKEWNTKSDGSGVPYSSGGNYTANQEAILYAIWELFNYTLSITQSAQGVTTNILRTSSPIGQAPTGAITNGTTLYYNDEISIDYTIGGAYQLLTATVNNVDISEETLPYVVTVNSNVVISITAKLGAIVYIGNEAYQAFIGNGTSWVQCQAFIGNGTSWDTY